MYCTHFVTYKYIQSDINIVYCFNLSKYLLLLLLLLLRYLFLCRGKHNNSFRKGEKCIDERAQLTQSQSRSQTQCNWLWVCKILQVLGWTIDVHTRIRSIPARKHSSLCFTLLLLTAAITDWKFICLRLDSLAK